MSKELDKLERAFNAQSTVKPDAKAKDRAIMAAMQAYEDEEFSNIFQGTSADMRLMGHAGKKPVLSKWRDVMRAINSKWVWTLTGSASVAVLALVIAGPILDDAKNGTLQTEQKRVSDDNVGGSENAIEHHSTVTTDVQPELGSEAPAEAPVQADLEEFAANRVQQLMAPQIETQSKELMIQQAPNLPFPDGSTHKNPDQGRDKFSVIDENPVKVTEENPVSTFSVDVDTASYAFMRKSLNQNVLPQANSVRVEEFINYFDYGYDAPVDETEPFKVNLSIMPTPWNEGTKLLSIGIKGYEIERSEAPSSNLVFLIDTSGSMNAADKLPLLKNSFKLLLSSLKPTDTISIVAYAGSAGTVLEPTKVEQRHKILAALDNLGAGGATAGAEGIRQAYNLAESSFRQDGVNRVILATDGDFNVGINNTEELKSFIERKRNTGVTLSVLGFGRGNYNDELMQSLAQNGNGNANYIDTLSEARKVLVEEAGSTLFTIAKDVKLQLEFNPDLISEYRLIGYETRALAREDFKNDKVDAGDIGAGHTVTALYELTPVNSQANLVDPLRYGNSSMGQGENNVSSDSNEYGFLKIRYKLPDGEKSKLITRPLTTADEVNSIESATVDARFAASVAAFGQLLRGGKYVANFSYDDVIDLALSGKGDDKFGYRSEFINLVRLAKSAPPLPPLEQ